MKRCLLIIVGLLSFCPLTKSQDADSLLFASDTVLAELDSILNSEDSLSVLGLVDSLLALDVGGTQLAIRIGYNSNVNSTSRSLNINKFGLASGLSYYHKSGVYADATTYWSKEYDPSVYLTVLSAGYLGSINKYWSVMGEYGHYFYSYTATEEETETTSTSLTPPEPTFTPYTNNILVSNFIDIRKLMLRLDYSLLFGEKSVHRISPVIGLNLSKKNWIGIDRISFFPSANLLYGNETVVNYVLIPKTRLEAIIRYRNGLPLFASVEEKKWGVMNYSFSVPLSISISNWSFLLSYSYNIPQQLPGEDLGLENSGFASVSLTRYFDF